MSARRYDAEIVRLQEMVGDADRIQALEARVAELEQAVRFIAGACPPRLRHYNDAVGLNDIAHGFPPGIHLPDGARKARTA